MKIRVIFREIKLFIMKAIYAIPRDLYVFLLLWMVVAAYLPTLLGIAIIGIYLYSNYLVTKARYKEYRYIYMVSLVFEKESIFNNV